MKNFRLIFVLSIYVLLLNIRAFATGPVAGFYLPDSVNEMTLKYRTAKGLIVLPVTINDSIQVNLILDTGCRNLILFGKKFKKLFRMSSRKPLEFSGLGSGRPATGKLSIGNKVSINEVLGEQIPVVIVDSNNLFGNYHNVHGVIGYDIFLKFEIELNASARTITFRPAIRTIPRYGFTQVPLKIIDARPIMQSQIYIDENSGRSVELMIDTGSSLGLLLKTTNISQYDHHQNEKVLGIGFNGPLTGYHTISKRLILTGLEMEEVPTGIVASRWHNNASIGMEVLKDYIVILNYCKSYASFKRNVA
ncbi:MAG: aspartyl protease family protein [Cyclobacteriaceae bacterium]